MADQKISELTNITGANLADADEFVVVDTSADQTKAVTRAEFFKNTPSIDVTGTVTADGLTVDGNADVSGHVDVGNAYSLRWGDGNERITGNNTGLLDAFTNNTKRLNINSGGDISFYESLGVTPKFFWDASAESLGIGTTTPSEKLEVAGNIILDATDANIKIKSGATGTAGAVNFTFSTDSTSFGSLSLPYDTRSTVGLLAQTISAYPVSISSGTTNSSTNAVILSTSGTEAMRIDNLGNLLVGKTAINVAADGIELHSLDYIAATRDNAPSLYLNRRTFDGDIVEFRKDNIPVGRIGSRSGVVSYIALDPRTGGAGLTGGAGTVAPSTNLGAASDGAVNLGASNIRFKDIFLSGGLRGDTLTFSNLANAELMRINSSGNLLVGTASDQTGSASGSGGAYIGTAGSYMGLTRNGGVVQYLNRIGTDGDIAVFSKNGAPVGSIGSYAGGTGNLDVSSGGTTTKLRLQNMVEFIDSRWSANEQVTPTKSGVDLGGAGTTWENLFLSGGVVFGTGGPAPITSNTLDDYEEGTWTPTVSVETNVSSTSVVAARYTKIGRIVTCILDMDTSVTSAAAEALFRITLPFSAHQQANYPVGSACILLGSGANRTGLGVVTQLSADATQIFVVFAANQLAASGAATLVRATFTYEAA